MSLKKLVLCGPLAATVLALSACGGQYGHSTQSSGEPAARPAVREQAQAAASRTAEPPKVLKVTKLEGWMPFVTNDKGRTIYRFDDDSANPSKSTCFDECAKTWEPVLAPNGEWRIQGDGIDANQVGLIDRPEGQQVTLDGWPLYYFKNDQELGETSGHGVADKWFAIGPDGAKSCKESDW
ncbi:MAG: hypothetical protein ACRDT8_07970 [Micromonosporaceae bacterium]